jgi:hypothetical protein
MVALPLGMAAVIAGGWVYYGRAKTSRMPSTAGLHRCTTPAGMVSYVQGDCPAGTRVADVQGNGVSLLPDQRRLIEDAARIDAEKKAAAEAAAGTGSMRFNPSEDPEQRARRIEQAIER